MKNETLRIAVIAVVAVVVAKLLLPHVPGLQKLAGYV